VLKFLILITDIEPQHFDATLERSPADRRRATAKKIVVVAEIAKEEKSETGKTVKIASGEGASSRQDEFSGRQLPR